MDLPGHLLHASFSPPNLAADENPGKWVLLDNEAYFSDQENSTTAEYHRTVDDKLTKVKVTFCLAKPPLVSYFCIHCPGLDPKQYGREPRILATEERFALLRLPIRNSSRVRFQEYSDYFIYQASRQNPPSLRLLPNPRPLEFADNAIGILPRHTHEGVTFVLAALQPRQIGVYKLHLFSGMTNRWTSRVVSCHQPLPQNYSFCGIDKVVTIGTKKGLMGWVDLWRGILICDVLSKNPVLQYVTLPTPAVPHVSGLGSPRIVRDMVAAEGKGTLKYFEMKQKVIQGTRLIQGFVATTWSTQREHSWKWHEECTFDVFDVIVVNDSNIELLTSPKVYDNTNPAFSLCAASPALSLDDDHLVYFMAKLDYSVDNAWIVSVDMKNQLLLDVAEFNAKRTLGLRFSYLRSTISRFMYLSSPQDREDPAERGGMDQIALEQCKVPQNPMGTDSNATSDKNKNKDVA